MCSPWVVVPFACLFGLQVRLYLPLVPERFPKPAYGAPTACSREPCGDTFPRTMTMCGLSEPLEVNRLRSNARREPLVR
jgi:hypothetical protein